MHACDSLSYLFTHFIWKWKHVIQFLWQLSDMQSQAISFHKLFPTLRVWNGEVQTYEDKDVCTHQCNSLYVYILTFLLEKENWPSCNTPKVQYPIDGLMSLTYVYVDLNLFLKSSIVYMMLNRLYVTLVFCLQQYSIST